MLSSGPGQQPQEQMLVCTCSQEELVCQASAKHRSRLSPLGQSRRLLLPCQQGTRLPVLSQEHGEAAMQQVRNSPDRVDTA